MDFTTVEDVTDQLLFDVPLPTSKRPSGNSTPTTMSTPTSTTTMTLSTSSRPNSEHGTETTDDEMEDMATPAPLCRRDGALEIATSLWGLVPPKNFGRVMEGVYRSSFPQPENLPFLKTLGLKTILTLVPGPYPEPHEVFVKENDIQHFQIAIEPNKSPFLTISQCSISMALGVILDKSNYPLLVHCNKGKHRTGCVIGALRKILSWDLTDLVDEYHAYADPKARQLDERYLELFDERAMLWLARKNGLLPPDEPRVESPISSLALGGRLRS